MKWCPCGHGRTFHVAGEEYDPCTQCDCGHFGAPDRRSDVADEEVPWPDDAPPDEEVEHENGDDDRETLRGLVTDWQNEKGKGPARCKIAGVKSQVWPYDYQDEDRTEKSEVYRVLKLAAVDDGAVEAIGEYKEQEKFYSEKAKKWIEPPDVFQVYEADPIEVTSEMKKAGDVAKRAVPSKGAPRGKGGGQDQYKMSKEEWAEKDRQTSAAVRSAWAVQTAVSALVTGKGEPPTMDQIETVAGKLLEIADRTRETILASGSGSATASPTPTSDAAPSSAPASKASAPSKASKKPAKTSKSD